MKSLLLLTALFTAGVLLAGSSEVTYVPHDKVAAALAKGATMIKASDLSVQGSHRTGPGHVEVHDRETDVFYVTDGEATFITGGAVVGDKVTSPGQHSGSDIQGGESHHLSKGDVIVIPAGVPHWFKEVPQSVTYYVVKVIKQ